MHAVMPLACDLEVRQTFIGVVYLQLLEKIIMFETLCDKLLRDVTLCDCSEGGKPKTI
jgi:hypothetical protein